MYFDFSAEQKMIAEQMATLFKRIGEEADLRNPDEALERCRGRLGSLAEAGITTLLTPGEFGGLDLGMVEALAIMMEAGGRLLPVPIAEAMSASAIMAEAGHPGAEQVASGERLATIAWCGALAATGNNKGVSLTGELSAVPFAGIADFLIAPVSLGDGRLALSIVDLADKAVRIDKRDDFDPAVPVFSVSLDALQMDAAGWLIDKEGAARQLEIRGSILLAGDLCGAARQNLQQVLEHVRNRAQFGRPIGANQAIKHMASDAFVAIEHMSVAAQYAAWAADQGLPDAEQSARIAKAIANQSARLIAENCIQMMGGLGYCWEFDQHLFLKRALRCGASAGTTLAHHEAIAETLLPRSAA